jgi:hypothetical protein
MEYFEFKIHLPKLRRRWLVGLAVLLIGAVVFAMLQALAPEPPQPSHELRLTRRKTNSGYGTAAYSFLERSQDVNQHGNAVDIRFEACGALHIGSTGRTDRFAELGPGELEVVTSVPQQGWNATWMNGRDYIVPRPGDVYILGIKDRDREARFYVKFVVRKVSDEAVDLTWAYLNEESASTVRALGPRSSKRGRSGLCGLCNLTHRGS